MSQWAFKYQLPSFYQNILSERVLNWFPQETKATCDQCIMSKNSRSPTYYAPELKCCTFYPYLPNFLVGAILSDPSKIYDGARDVLRQKISRRHYSLPCGMVAPIRYQIEFKENKKEKFGKEQSWLCPYYNKSNQNCGVWRYRGVVCTTFYCRSSFGRMGKNRWALMSDYLSYVEMALMEEALVMLDFSPRQVVELLGYLNRDQGTKMELCSWALLPKKSRQLWNGYFDEQEVFFKKCYQIVNKIKRKNFEEIIGIQGLELEAQTEKVLSNEYN